MANIYQTSVKIYYQGTDLDRNIPFLKEYTNLNALTNPIKLRIISQLEHLRPGKNSKSVHYGKKLDKSSTQNYNMLIINTLQDIKNSFTMTNHA